MGLIEVEPAAFIKADDWQFQYRQKSNCSSSNLTMLSYGTFDIKSGITSDEIYHHKEETILFCIKGKVNVQIGSQGLIYALFLLCRLEYGKTTRKSPRQMATMSAGSTTMPMALSGRILSRARKTIGTSCIAIIDHLSDSTVCGLTYASIPKKFTLLTKNL